MVAMCLHSRYFHEDIPGGLCTLRGVAEIVGVSTPKIDELIEWAQTQMGMECVPFQSSLSNSHFVCTFFMVIVPEHVRLRITSSLSFIYLPSS